MNDDFDLARDPYATSSVPVRMIWGSARFIFFIGVVLVFGIGMTVLYFRLQQAGQGSRIVIDGGAENLTAAERTALQLFLATQAGNLSEPAGWTGDIPAEFTVNAGQNANQIALNLSSSGILDPSKETLFLNYLRFYGLDPYLEAGNFVIEPDVTIAELASILTEASFTDDIELRFLEGWRVEQMANYLAVTQPAAIDSAQFLSIVQREIPFDLSPYAYLAGVSAESTLEGFLFPDTYQVPIDADAAYLVNLMLSTFDQRITPSMRQAYQIQGLSIQDAVTLASIVEREAVIPDEQPTIAKVFINRLNVPMKLDADPTVQYAVGSDEAWWKVPLTLDDLAADSPYNTYLYTGLPPSPLANPGFGALQAVAAPEQVDFLFFVASCVGTEAGSHIFSVTYEDHLVNVQNCR